MMHGGTALCVVILLLYHVDLSGTSIGDRSNAHQDCLKSCYRSKCADKPSDSRGVWINPKFNLLVWDCEAKCDYDCMWDTVKLFQDHNVKVPQFYGKWPFVKLYGVQEPASALFSILNAVAHIYSIIQFRKLVPSISPMYRIWHGYCLVAANTWLWSTVFHTRDYEFTENMDYMCATALVAYQLFSIFARVLILRPRIYLYIVSLIIGALCMHHIYNMLFVHFDYGYHVKMNIIIGVLNALAWVGWCIKVQGRQPYVWKAYTSILLVGLCLSLEVLDFPPIAWVFDAHSLWHAGTAPLTLLWYSFVIDDCNHMAKFGNQPS